MSKAIFRVRGNGFLAGSFAYGYWGRRTLTCSADEGPPETIEVPRHGSVRQITADGDTVNVSSQANFGIRFLGIDTPESRLPRPGTDTFASTDDAAFRALLADPFGPDHAPVEELDEALRADLAARAGPGAAENHHAHAKDAEDVLEALIAEDAQALGREAFFLAFAYDAIEYYGRLLAYVHPDQPGTPRRDRRESYNLRMLRSGHAAPYFIFPNVDPFRARGSPVEAAARATDQPTILADAPALETARATVAAAREAGLGMFDPARPLAFQAFELRFLARRAAPSRWVIDLSAADRRLLPPQRYIEIPRLEDRLWVPPEFVPLFGAAGWRVEGDPMA